jgi:hypothetical protein
MHNIASEMHFPYRGWDASMTWPVRGFIPPQKLRPTFEYRVDRFVVVVDVMVLIVVIEDIS